MKEANKRVFSILTNFADQADDLSYPTGIRYIKTNEEDKKWLKNLKIVKRQSVLPTLNFATIQFDGKEYFVAVGWKDSIRLSEIITPVDLNAGLVTALISEIEISVRRNISAIQIVDEILFQCKESESDYSGHNFEDIILFFEPLIVYEILDDSLFKADDITQISGYYISKNFEKLSLPFSETTLLDFEKTFIEDSPHIPYENLLLSLTSVHWKYSFLDIYRCLERLFPIVALDNFHQELNLGISLLEFSEKMENATGWRPIEEHSLRKLIKNSPEDATQLLREIKEFLDKDSKVTPPEKFYKIGERSLKTLEELIESSPADAIQPLHEIKEFLDKDSKGDLAKRFYKIRNSIVHFRPATEQIELDDENWDKLIRSSLKIIRYWFKKYDSRLE
ncbi:hypothetical protein [Desulfonema ishimotonii]|nr:hypothetical protein [Desulfonema ishimotonii]